MGVSTTHRINLSMWKLILSFSDTYYVRAACGCIANFYKNFIWFTYMPTLPNYPGVSRIRQQSPGLPYGSPNLPDKIELWAFLCFNLEFIPFSPKIRIFYDSKFGFWGIFTRISSLTKSWKLIVMVCNSSKTSYNVLSRLGTGLNCAYGGRRGVDRWYLGG